MRKLDYAERLEVEAALSVALEPLRAARADLSPLRVRAAVRWGRGEPRRSLRWTRAIARLGELSAAAGVAGMIFVASVGTPVAEPAVALPGGQAMFDPGSRSVPAVRASLATDRPRWFRLGHYLALQDFREPAMLPTPLGAGSPSAHGPF